MRSKIEKLLPLAGMNLQGDVGGLTVYQSKRGPIVSFPKAPPKMPPSVLQSTFRNMWRMYGQIWRTLTEAERQQWRLTAARLRLRTSGAGLFYSFMRTQDRTTLATYARLARTVLTLPTNQFG